MFLINNLEKNILSYAKIVTIFSISNSILNNSLLLLFEIFNISL